MLGWRPSLLETRSYERNNLKTILKTTSLSHLDGMSCVERQLHLLGHCDERVATTSAMKETARLDRRVLWDIVPIQYSVCVFFLHNDMRLMQKNLMYRLLSFPRTSTLPTRFHDPKVGFSTHAA